MNEQFPKSEGGLWINRNKDTEKHPDWRGHIEVTSAQIKKLVEMGRAGLEVKLSLAMWDRQSKAGEDYKYLSAEAYIKEEKKPAADDWSSEEIPF